MADFKEIPESKVSLKYMAWNVKQMDETFKKIEAHLANIVRLMQKGPGADSDDSLPF